MKTLIKVVATTLFLTTAACSNNNDTWSRYSVGSQDGAATHAADTDGVKD